MIRPDKTLATPLTEEQVIDAARRKRPGVWRYVQWKMVPAITIDGAVVTVVKAGWFRIGIKYDNIKDVILTKAKEDEAAGCHRVRRMSSYVRPLDASGNPMDPFFIVRDRKTQDNKYLQVFPAKIKDGKTKRVRPIVHYIYKDGVLVDPVADRDLIEKVEAKIKSKAKSEGPIVTFVIKINQLIEIK